MYGYVSNVPHLGHYLEPFLFNLPLHIQSTLDYLHQNPNFFSTYHTPTVYRGLCVYFYYFRNARPHKHHLYKHYFLVSKTENKKLHLIYQY